MSDLTMLGAAALFGVVSWLLVAMCDGLMGTRHER
jgi:hypothetical protein